MSLTDERELAIKTLSERVKGIGIVMLTTAEPDGSLRSRPMVVQQRGFEGEFWFLARANSRLIWDIQRHPKVNLNFSDPDSDRYVSVTGMASTLRDRKIAESLWTSTHQGYFEGLDDPQLCLIKVVVESAQAWIGKRAITERIEGFIHRA